MEYSRLIVVLSGQSQGLGVAGQGVIKDGDIVHVTGARPNFPKAAPVIAALAKLRVNQRLVHTGQHYDDALSDSFFRQLDLPKPDINLGVGSGTHAAQTAAIMAGFETTLGTAQPSLVVVYGDVNSTVAAALVAAKLGIPVAHVEAGLRSFDLTMPEEINRKMTDQLSQLLFITSPEAELNLIREGIAKESIYFVGNPMIDTLLAHLDQFDSEKIQNQLQISDKYAVATLHRPANVDEVVKAKELVTALGKVSEFIQVIFPVHPRSKESLAKAGIGNFPKIRVIDPLGYIEFISLVRGSDVVITDSGGVQEETTILGIPCLTLRPNTERPITITHGTNSLVTTEQLEEKVKHISKVKSGLVPPLWDGLAGPRIADVIAQFLELSK